MRLSSAAALCVFALSSLPAYADSRVFIIANQPDGYGIDECLANGASCGASAARMYCESHQFARASSYHRVENEDITGAIPASTRSPASRAEAYVAITCQR
ncbi:hypothetical protein [Afipia sp. 1NLS2]|uniref:hypothetical protein n=1 Tax=Afipia sp. 1NLS2 TaxID=666684 RepID=UPI0001D9E13E|nr:hypothetical protein [Afipia sp. 1NLS2]EFI51649.1 conserved hypothetical protein [Afipia sp. 1NLS2]